MVIHQSKRINTGARLFHQISNALQKFTSVCVVMYNASTLDPTDNHMMQGSRRI